MKRIYLLFFLFLVACSGNTIDSKKVTEQERWERHAANTEIIRDDFGVPHIYGKTDADAVFGLLYAQCEDDFNRVEHNYIWAVGRLAEVEGEAALYSDLRALLYMTKDEAIANFESSPEWLQKLCVAFADGINYYLATHPEVTPKLLTRFEPWMPMYFSEGSIGGDIERVSTRKIRDFYDQPSNPLLTEIHDGLLRQEDDEPRGSNGIAISGKLTETGNAMLLINPHTSFFFRGEVHVVSEEGLNAYGAVTWGQFFVYQGFNEKTGWMHTSTGTDIIDEFEETIIKGNSGLTYKYGNEFRPVDSTEVELHYKGSNGMETRKIMMYKTHHGPITHSVKDKWIATALMWKPVKALEQSFVRTKQTGHDGFRNMMDIRTNSSNNTVYADAQGNIAYYHGNFIPKRDIAFDHTKPVDGSNPKTDWRGLHTVDENILVVNPPNGWIQNCNSTPFTCAAEYSPKREGYPAYMSSFPENFRGMHAVNLLKNANKLTLDKLIELAYDPYVPLAEMITPGLIQAFDATNNPEPALKEAVEVLRQWDFTTSKESVSMSLIHYYLKVYYAQHGTPPRRTNYIRYIEMVADSLPASERISHFKEALDLLTADFGRWNTPWGEINRYQRINGDIVQQFNDSLPSIPVGLTTGRWGSLASFGARTYKGSKRQYGTSGNSFVAVVEFGDRVRAKSLLAGGQSGDPESPHFDDQAQRYADCEFKDVAYYREDVIERAESRYHPGEKR